MTAGEIKAAAERYQKRLDAAGMNASVLGEGSEAIEAAFRRAASGLDIDPEEVREAASQEAPAILVASLAGLSPVAIATGQWVNGLIVGLLVAEARQREGAKA